VKSTVEKGLLLLETKVVIVKEKLLNTGRRGPDNVDGIILDGEQASQLGPG